MLAAFNVTALADFGYPETTHFIDPMEPRYRAVDYSASDYKSRSGPFSDDAIKAKLDFFIKLDAYNKVDEVEIALAKYWSTHTGGAAASAAPSKGPAASVSATRTASADDKEGFARSDNIQDFYFIGRQQEGQGDYKGIVMYSVLLVSFLLRFWRSEVIWI